METAIRKATRLEYRPPKEKHLLTLKNLTFENPASVDGILMNLEKRLKERSWIITYKVLIILHYLMREGNCVRVVDALIKRPGALDASRIKNKSHTPANVQNIYLYRAYLDERVVAFRHLRRDYVTETSPKEKGRLRTLLIKDGLLKETAALQRQMESVLKCKFYLDEKDPQLTYVAYRMVIEDLLALFQAVNEGVVNILEHYFEMSKANAAVALDIYKTFAQQAELTIDYLNEARRLENDLQMSIPAIKHAPLSLAAALEEYLNDESAGKNAGQEKPLPIPGASQAPSSAQQQPPQQALQQQPAAQQQVFSPQQSFAPQQPTMQQAFSPQQPTMQQAFAPQQPMLQQSPSQPQNAVSNNQALLDAAFSTENRRPSTVSPHPLITSPQMTATSPQNPFRTLMNQPSPTTTASTGFSSPFATISTPGYSPHTNNTSYLSSSFSAATTAGHSSNPFRSLSISSPSGHTALGSIDFNSAPQQIAVAKPSPYQLHVQPTGSLNASNPFSPMTPPLTPNPPLSNNAFMPAAQSSSNLAPNPFLQYQQQQQQQQQQHPAFSTSAF